MSEQDGTQATTLIRPTNDDEVAWEGYWKTQGQPWRLMPEIDVERQKYLDERRSITPDIEQGIYPLKDIDQTLSRADVEWLLATHENGRGPVDWNDESQRTRKGLDLRGADLRGEDLFMLPLARLITGIGQIPIEIAFTRIEDGTIHLEGADLSKAHLEGANLWGAFFDKVTFLNEIVLSNNEYGTLYLADIYWGR